jgi:hypothetical protein
VRVCTGGYVVDELAECATESYTGDGVVEFVPFQWRGESRDLVLRLFVVVVIVVVGLLELGKELEFVKVGRVLIAQGTPPKGDGRRTKGLPLGVAMYVKAVTASGKGTNLISRHQDGIETNSTKAWRHHRIPQRQRQQRVGHRVVGHGSKRTVLRFG